MRDDLSARAHELYDRLRPTLPGLRYAQHNELPLVVSDAEVQLMAEVLTFIADVAHCSCSCPHGGCEAHHDAS